MVQENRFSPESFGTASEADVVAIIPARGGSKGIPKKNIMPLFGKPLIAYSIQAALASLSIGRVIVSTDDEEIAAIARDWGADVPMMRPKEMASDTAPISASINHLMTCLLKNEGYGPDVQVVLYPSHPFRTPAMIDSMVQKLLEGNYSTATTFRRIEPQDAVFYFQGNDEKLIELRDQDRQPGIRSYCRSYGSVVIRSTHFQSCSHYAYMLTNPFELVDIDEWEDLFFAEEIVKRNLYDFGL